MDNTMSFSRQECTLGLGLGLMAAAVKYITSSIGYAYHTGCMVHLRGYNVGTVKGSRNVFGQ